MAVPDVLAGSAVGVLQQFSKAWPQGWRQAAEPAIVNEPDLDEVTQVDTVAISVDLTVGAPI